GAHFLDAWLPGPGPARSRRGGEKRRGAWAPADPRPNAWLLRAHSHLSPRAIRKHGLCGTDYAARAMQICEEQDIAQHHALALCVNGWSLSASGETEKGSAQIAQGVDSYGGLGSSKHILLALQADAQLAIGKPEAALVSVTAG